MPAQHKDLLTVPLVAYHEVDGERWPGLLVYRTVKTVFGAERVVVTTFNPTLWEGQMKGLRAQRAKIELALQALQTKLGRWEQSSPPKGRKPTPESVRAVVARILRRREPGPFLRYESRLDEAGVLHLSYHWDEAAMQAMIDRHFGKTLLFSDQLGWTDEQIVAAYRSQAKIEDAFKQMKDPHFVSWRPLLHWTDQKVRVHAAYCVFALLLAALLQREVRHAGLTPSLDALLETLAGIKGVIDLPRPGGRRRSLPVSIRLTRREPEEERLFQILGLARFHPEVTPTMTGTTT